MNARKIASKLSDSFDSTLVFLGSVPSVAFSLILLQNCPKLRVAEAGE